MRTILLRIRMSAKMLLLDMYYHNVFFRIGFIEHSSNTDF